MWKYSDTLHDNDFVYFLKKKSVFAKKRYRRNRKQKVFWKKMDWEKMYWKNSVFREKILAMYANTGARNIMWCVVSTARTCWMKSEIVRTVSFLTCMWTFAARTGAKYSKRTSAATVLSIRIVWWDIRYLNTSIIDQI